jgi:hypothetical protein
MLLYVPMQVTTEQDSRELLYHVLRIITAPPRRLVGAQCEDVVSTLNGRCIIRLFEQQPVLARRAVRVHPQEREAIELRQASMLASCWVADGVAQVPIEAAEDEEAVAGGPDTEVRFAESRDGLELVDGGEACPVVEGDDV